ncbi:hypothetical protein L1283_001771 [Sphingobacterium sp. HSC-15S19]
MHTRFFPQLKMPKKKNKPIVPLTSYLKSESQRRRRKSKIILPPPQQKGGGFNKKHSPRMFGYSVIAFVIILFIVILFMVALVSGVRIN